MFCQRTKAYLSQKQVAFQERDVTKDAEAVAELQRLGYVTTPVTVIDGAVIIGFDTAKIDAALSS
jgi:glutaredoxin